MTGQQWTQALSEAWNRAAKETKEYAELRAQVDGQRPFSVQDSWDCFMSCMKVCFVDALRALSETELDVDQAEELRRLRAQNGKETKGKPAVFQWYNNATKAGGQQKPWRGAASRAA